MTMIVMMMIMIVIIIRTKETFEDLGEIVTVKR